MSSTGRRGALVVAALLTLLLLAAPVAAQEIPKPPPEAIPVLEAASPTTWTACNMPAAVLGFVSFAQTLIPPDVRLPYNPADALAIVTPLTAVFYDSCALVPLPAGIQQCAMDASFATLAQLGAPGPFAYLVLQVAALENAAILGAPISSAIAAAGGCTIPKATAPQTPPAGAAAPALAPAPASNAGLSGDDGSGLGLALGAGPDALPAAPDVSGAAQPGWPPTPVFPRPLDASPHGYSV